MNDDVTRLDSPDEAAIRRIQQNAAMNRLIEQNMAIIDQLETIASLSKGVTIRGFNVPFLALVGLLVKLALASIPAFVVLAFVGFIIWVVGVMIPYALLIEPLLP